MFILALPHLNVQCPSFQRESLICCSSFYLGRMWWRRARCTISHQWMVPRLIIQTSWRQRPEPISFVNKSLKNKKAECCLTFQNKHVTYSLYRHILSIKINEALNVARPLMEYLICYTLSFINVCVMFTAVVPVTWKCTYANLSHNYSKLTFIITVQ